MRLFIYNCFKLGVKYSNRVRVRNINKNLFLVNTSGVNINAVIVVYGLEPPTPLSIQ